jgi:hypothetical protein
MKKLAILALMAFATTANASDNSGLYLGGGLSYNSANIGNYLGASAGSTSVTGFGYNLDVGYKFNDYFAAEVSNQTASLSGGTSTDTRTVKTSGTIYSLLLFPTGGEFFLKAGTGSMNNDISGSKTVFISSLFTSYFATVNYSGNYSSRVSVFGLGTERGDGHWKIRSGLDLFSMTSSVGGNDALLQLYANINYAF